MFKEKIGVFYYTISPVHMGAGTALGMVDNPIQREVHTGHPVFAGSGIKGAFRHEAEARAGKNKSVVEALFGPPPGKGDKHAGAVSFSDAQLVFFPVRSLRDGFVFVTSKVALQRALRLLKIAGCEIKEGAFLDGLHLKEEEAVLGGDRDTLVLESFWFTQKKGCTQDYWEDLARLVKRIASMLCQDNPFVEKLKRDVVLVSEEVFNHFVENATMIEPHVRINDATGTAEDQGLFYTENLPPETIMLGLMMLTDERTEKNSTSQKEGKEKGPRDAKELWKEFKNNNNFFKDCEVIQLGGDTTTGRGLVQVKFVCED